MEPLTKNGLIYMYFQANYICLIQLLQICANLPLNWKKSNAIFGLICKIFMSLSILSVGFDIVLSSTVLCKCPFAQSKKRSLLTMLIIPILCQSNQSIDLHDNC